MQQSTSGVAQETAAYHTDESDDLTELTPRPTSKTIAEFEAIRFFAEDEKVNYSRSSYRFKVLQANSCTRCGSSAR